MSAKKAKSKKRPAGNQASSRVASTPLWMRAVIILIAVAFIGTSIALVVGNSASASKTSAATSGVDSYETAVNSALVALDADTTDADLLANVGTAYFNWAVERYENGDQAKAVQYWEVAVSYYNRSLEGAPDSQPVLYAKAAALYYAGDADAAAALMIFIASSKDTTTYAEQVVSAQEMLSALQSAETTGSAP